MGGERKTKQAVRVVACYIIHISSARWQAFWSESDAVIIQKSRRWSRHFSFDILTGLSEPKFTYLFLELLLYEIFAFSYFFC